MKISHTYGLFLWKRDGVYPAHAAVKTYKHSKVADRACDKRNAAEFGHAAPSQSGYVVRPITHIDYDA